MEFITQLVTAISLLDRKKLHLSLGISIAVMSMLSLGLWYTLHARRNAHIETLKKLHEQSQKNDILVQKNGRIKAEEERVQSLLDENANFSIKTYFEEFCRDHGVTAEDGWGTETRSIDGSETFDEVLLSATFTRQTTQNIVGLLHSLDTSQIVYIKELEIKKENKSFVSCSLIIATKKRKQFWDE